MDIAGLLLAILGFYWGFQKGLLAAFLGLVGLLLGLVLAMKCASLLSLYLIDLDFLPSAWVPLISYLLLFIGVLFLVGLFSRALESLITALKWNGVNRFLGGVAYASMTVLFWSTLLWLGHQMHLFSPETIAQSRTFPLLEPLPSLVLEKIGEYWPMVDPILEDFSDYFDQINQQLPEHVGLHRSL